MYLTYFSKHAILKIHSGCHKWQYFIFFYGWVVFHCVHIYAPHLYPVICGRTLWLFQCLGHHGQCCSERREHISLQINVFKVLGWILKRDIAGSYGNSILNFLRNCYTLFHSGCTSLHFSQLWMSVPFFFPHNLFNNCYYLTCL